MMPIIGILALSQTPPNFEANLLALLRADGFDKKMNSMGGMRFHLAVGQSTGPYKLTISAAFFDPPAPAGKIDSSDANGGYTPTAVKLKTGETIERMRSHMKTFVYRANLRKAYVYVDVSNAVLSNKKPISEAKSDALGKNALEDFAAAIKKSTKK